METWQTLSGGSKWAFQLDGIITRTGKYYPARFSRRSIIEHNVTRHIWRQYDSSGKYK